MAVLALTACSSNPTDSTKVPIAVKVAPYVQSAAYLGTAYTLSEHPEWRKDFVIAQTQLGVLLQAPTIDYSTVLGIVGRLPVKELKSKDAQLAITGGQIVLATVSQSTNLGTLETIRPVVQALYDGVTKGLAYEAPAQP